MSNPNEDHSHKQGESGYEVRLLEQFQTGLQAIAIRTEQVDGKVDRLTAMLSRNAEIDRDRIDGVNLRLGRVEDKYHAEVVRELAALRLDTERRVSEVRRDQEARLAEMRATQDTRDKEMTALMASVNMRVMMIMGGLVVASFVIDKLFPKIFP